MEFDKYRKYNENIKDMMSTLTRRRAQFNIYTSNSLAECVLTCGGGVESSNSKCFALNWDISDQELSDQVTKKSSSSSWEKVCTSLGERSKPCESNELRIRVRVKSLSLTTPFIPLPKGDSLETRLSRAGQDRIKVGAIPKGGRPC